MDILITQDARLDSTQFAMDLSRMPEGMAPAAFFEPRLNAIRKTLGDTHFYLLQGLYFFHNRRFQDSLASERKGLEASFREDPDLSEGRELEGKAFAALSGTFRLRGEDLAAISFAERSLAITKHPNLLALGNLVCANVTQHRYGEANRWIAFGAGLTTDDDGFDPDAFAKCLESSGLPWINLRNEIPLLSLLPGLLHEPSI